MGKKTHTPISLPHLLRTLTPLEVMSEQCMPLPLLSW